MLTGQPFSGKTWLCLHMIRSVTTAEPLLGRVVNDGPHLVVYIPTDGGARSEDARRAQLLQTPPRRLLIADGDLSTWADVSAATELAQTWRGLGVTCAVFDNLHSLLPAAAEVNSDAHMRPIARGLQAVADTGIAVLVVHHSAKPGLHGSGGKGAMGSQLLTAWPRRMLHLDRPRRDAPLVRLRVTNNNTPSEELAFHLAAEICKPLDADEARAEHSGRLRDLERRAEQVRQTLVAASFEERGSITGLGRVVHRLGLSVSPDGGRKKAEYWKRCNLLEVDPETRALRQPASVAPG
ncbi:MAG: ATPase [Frankiales bacterium]|nr:ATPase [Frankiales bacterium]